MPFHIILETAHGISYFDLWVLQLEPRTYQAPNQKMHMQHFRYCDLAMAPILAISKNCSIITKTY